MAQNIKNPRPVKNSNASVLNGSNSKPLYPKGSEMKIIDEDFQAESREGINNLSPPELRDPVPDGQQNQVELHNLIIRQMDMSKTPEFNNPHESL